MNCRCGSQLSSNNLRTCVTDQVEDIEVREKVDCRDVLGNKVEQKCGKDSLGLRIRKLVTYLYTLNPLIFSCESSLLPNTSLTPSCSRSVTLVVWFTFIGVTDLSLDAFRFSTSHPSRR